MSGQSTMSSVHGWSKKSDRSKTRILDCQKLTKAHSDSKFLSSPPRTDVPFMDFWSQIRSLKSSTQKRIFLNGFLDDFYLFDGYENDESDHFRLWKWITRHDRHDCQSPLEAKWVMGPFSKRPTVYFLNKQRVLNKRSDEWLWCLFTIMLEIDKSSAD